MRLTKGRTVMKKKMIETYVLMLFAGALVNGIKAPEPTIPVVDGCKKIEIPTIEEHEVDVVEVSENDLESEEFCDSLEILATCVEAEAGNQDLKGKRLVADVVLNRVESPRFPDTIEGVISQKYQFTTFWDGSMDAVTEPSEETFMAVNMELSGERLDSEILFFTAGDYNRYCDPAYIVGDHYFGY